MWTNSWPKAPRKEEAILMVLKNYIRKSKAILFEGNNYSDEWKEEAESARTE
jgi:glutamine synthetase